MGKWEGNYWVVFFLGRDFTPLYSPMIASVITFLLESHSFPYRNCSSAWTCMCYVSAYLLSFYIWLYALPNGKFSFTILIISHFCNQNISNTNTNCKWNYFLFHICIGINCKCGRSSLFVSQIQLLNGFSNILSSFRMQSLPSEQSKFLLPLFLPTKNQFTPTKMWILYDSRAVH